MCRYRNAFTFGAPAENAEYKQILQKTSLREGARIFPLVTYHGVDIHIMDESSLMHTGTLKSIDGCISAAKCRLKGYKRIVFESGGNTGTALTEYGQRAGLETYCVVPEENLSLLDSRTFNSGKAHLISVAETGLVKRSASLLGGLNGIRHIPEVGWRYEASRFRGCFVLEHSTDTAVTTGWPKPSAPPSVPLAYTASSAVSTRQPRGFPGFWVFSRKPTVPCTQPGSPGTMNWIPVYRSPVPPEICLPG